MYINPNHPDPPQRPQPPPDDGLRLAAIERGDGREELRVTLKTYEGRPYLALRVWERDPDGGFWPVKGKGCSIRVTEIAKVITALQQAEAIAGGSSRQGPRQPRHGTDKARGGRSAGAPGEPRGAAPGSDWRALDLPALGDAPGPSEFTGDLDRG